MLSSLLNEKLIKIAPKHEISDYAPSSYKELFESSKLIVWSGASEATIYDDKQVNYAFRAWHDSLHIKLNADFTLEGETRVALEQARLIDSDKLAKILLAEVIGQAEYFAKHGEFPIDQIAFIERYLKEGA